MILTIATETFIKTLISLQFILNAFVRKCYLTTSPQFSSLYNGFQSHIKLILKWCYLIINHSVSSVLNTLQIMLVEYKPN